MIYIGQADVIEFLKKCDKPVTRKEIADGIDNDPITVSKALRRLLKWNEVDFIEYPQEEAAKLVTYIIRRRTRFFFIVEN